VSAGIEATVLPPTYPARPINGGPLELAPPKPGQWCYEPKYNGWRALVHAPTRAMFNRHGRPLSIAAEFESALSQLRGATVMVKGNPPEWFDCEALDRRHGLGRGTLLVFDYIPPPALAAEPLQQRKAVLTQALPTHDWRQVPQAECVYGVQPHDPAAIEPLELYRELRQLNKRWACPFYEGLVAKRITDPYPVQRRSPTEEFVGWIKHRWGR
jgi:ATP-dependent DNA ligase